VGEKHNPKPPAAPKASPSEACLMRGMTKSYDEKITNITMAPAVMDPEAAYFFSATTRSRR
jgi:hypothetical protein